MRKTRGLAILLAIFAMLMIVGLLVTSESAQAQLSRVRFPWIIATQLTVLTDADVLGDLHVDGSATINGVDVTGDTTVNNLTVNDFLTLDPVTPITVTSGGTITPTGSNLLLTSAGNVGTRLLVTTTLSNGALLFVQNVGSSTITLTDTAPWCSAATLHLALTIRCS